MKTKIKRGILVLLPVLAAGAVGAQMIEYNKYDPHLVAAESVTLPEPQPPTEVMVPPTQATAPAEPAVPPAPVAPIIVALPPPVERVVIELPRSVSSRSGEGSGEEIAMRTAPVDDRAGMSPLYQVDQSPGL